MSNKKRLFVMLLVLAGGMGLMGCQEQERVQAPFYLSDEMCIDTSLGSYHYKATPRNFKTICDGYNHEKVRAILKKNPELVNSFFANESILSRAMGIGNVEAAKLLVDMGANVNSRSLNDSSRPLHALTLGNCDPEGSLELAELLIEKGANVNAKDSYGNTPLQLACGIRWGAKDLIKLLILKGANVNTKNKNGTTPLLRATWASPHPHRAAIDKDVVELLMIAGADVRATWKTGETPLHGTARYGCYELSKILINKGVRVNAKLNNLGGETALYKASVYGRHKDVVELLIENGADVNVTTHDGTALHYACESGDKEMVEFLVSKGADVNAKGVNDHTPLLVATWIRKGTLWGTKLKDVPMKDRLDIIEVLISSGADVNAKSSSGTTLLKLALRQGNKEIITLLKKHGALH